MTAFVIELHLRTEAQVICGGKKEPQASPVAATLIIIIDIFHQAPRDDFIFLNTWNGNIVLFAIVLCDNVVHEF